MTIQRKLSPQMRVRLKITPEAVSIKTIKIADREISAQQKSFIEADILAARKILDKIKERNARRSSKVSYISKVYKTVEI